MPREQILAEACCTIYLLSIRKNPTLSPFLCNEVPKIRGALWDRLPLVCRISYMVFCALKLTVAQANMSPHIQISWTKTPFQPFPSLTQLDGQFSWKLST